VAHFQARHVSQCVVGAALHMHSNTKRPAEAERR